MSGKGDGGVEGLEGLGEEPPSKKARLRCREIGIAAAVQREIAMGTRSLKFGIVASAYPFWERSVAIGGDLQWIWSQASGRQGETTLSLMMKDQPVEVVLFDGPGPRAEHEVWACGSVNVIVWTVGTNRCGPHLTSSWVVVHHRVSHASLGGSTTRIDHIHVAVRTLLLESRGALRLRLPVSVGPGSLSRLVDGREKGRVCRAPAEGELGYLESLVDFRSRTELRRLPSFSSPTGFVLRPLTDKEWLRGLDCPATLLHVASDQELTQWASILLTPFKSRSHVVLSLADYLAPRAVTSSAPSEKRSLVEYDAGEPSLEPRLKRPRQSTKMPCSVPEEFYSFHQVEEQRVRSRMLEIPTTHTAEETVCLRQLSLSDSLVSKLSLISSQALKVPVPVADIGDIADVEGSEFIARNVKATKADDAEIPVYIWNQRIIRGLSRVVPPDSVPHYTKAFDTIRQFLLRYWRRRVARLFWNWWRVDKLDRGSKGLGARVEALEPGLLAIHHAMDASWWDWERGSAPFFWKFPSEWQKDMRDGLQPRFTGEPPLWKRPQRRTQDVEVFRLERAKISKVRARGYIAPLSDIQALLYFFSVQKGDDDIRMVYDGTKSGLNAVLFAPWFCLPTVDTLARSMANNYWSSDNDYGEMFLNFWLHPDLRPYCGIDLSRTFPEELGPGQATLWEAWTRNAMGLRPSPYASCQTGTRLKHLMLGNRLDPSNVFRWDRVVLNLPGSEGYDPSLPWVFKARADGSIAADIHKYVDDVRETAPTREEVEHASSRVAKIASYFGCQDAARKKRDASQKPGSWAGANVECVSTGVFKTVSQERWDKTKRLINDIESWSTLPSMPRKELERARGFLVYVALTFSIFSPYLKGVHLSLESWRHNRDPQGWKTTKPRDENGCNLSSVPDSVFQEKLGLEDCEDAEAPSRVKAVPRLASDVRALKLFTSAEHPPRMRIRPIQGAAILFIYADASGVGFGSSVWLQGSSQVQIEEGLWSLLYSEKSSNFREMCNITLRLEALVLGGAIASGTEIFVFTDNQVTERAFYRGTSSSPELFELVLRLKRLELTHHVFLRIIWVAGTRMIEQGTDGFSRGDLENGVATGRPMLAFVPLNLSPFDRSPTLEAWLRKSLVSDEDWILLEPSGWFDEGHSLGNFIWNVAPAAAHTALEQLCEAKLARPNAAHIFVCPALLTPMWRKRLGKIADVVFGIPPTVDFWAPAQHEPLLIGLVCPLLSSRPWQIKHCDESKRDLENVLRGMWSGDARAQRDRLRQFWTLARQPPDDNFPVLRASDLDDSVVDPSEFDEAEDENRFKEARNGDHFITPFQCDLCHFYNVRKRFPIDSESDRLFLKTIRRALLDSLWSRERSTVAKNLTELNLFVSNSKLLGNTQPLPPRGPFPTTDVDGIEVACNLLLRSLRPGRNAKTVQFETMRKGRSVYSNYVHSSYGGLGRVTIARGDRGGSVETASTTNSIWFGKFLSGCHRRMGDLWIPDRAMTIDEVLAALSILEDDWQAHASQPPLLLEIALTGALLVAGGGAGLRGEECPQMELGPLRKHWHEGEDHPRSPHVPLVLVGRFKQTEGLKLYFQPLAVKSKSGIEYKLWIQRVIGVWEMLGVTSGPVFRTAASKSKTVRRATVADLDLLLHDVLKRVQVRMPNVIPASVNVENEYSARRSLRRFFTTQAQNAGIPKDIIEANNRWRKHMHSRGRLPSMQMIERYSDAKASVEILIKASSLL